jgi:hypothetical protein
MHRSSPNKKLMCLKDSIEDRATEKIRVLEDIFRLHPNERVLVFTGTNIMAFEISRRFLAPTILCTPRKKNVKPFLKDLSRVIFRSSLRTRYWMKEWMFRTPKLRWWSVAKLPYGKQHRGWGASYAQKVRQKPSCTKLSAEIPRSDAIPQRRKGDAYERTRHRRI